MSVARSVARSVASPIARSVVGLNDEGGPRWTNSAPTLPSISGITLTALWEVPYGSETQLLDAVGNYDLTVVAGGPLELLASNTPGGKPAIYFDGTLELTAPTLPQGATGICLFIRPEDGAGIGKDYCGWGNGAGNQLSLYYDSDSNSGVRRDGASLGTALGPTMQWFVPMVTQSTGFTQVFNNGSGGSASGSTTTRTGFSLGGRFPGGSTGTRFRGWFFGGFVFDTPALGYPTNAQMDAMVRHWLGRGAIKSNAQRLLAISGDSIAAGTALTNAQSIPTLLRNSLGTGWNVYNVAIPGLATDTAVAHDVSYIDPFHANRERNVSVLIGEPSNQLASQTGAQAIASVTAWGEARIAAGFDAIICTCLDRTDFNSTQNGHKNTYNAQMRADFNVATANPYVFFPAPGTAYATVLVDIQAIAGMTFADGVHPNAAGAALIASAIKFAIDGSAVCADPVFDPQSSTFTSPISVEISTATSAANIYYTTDGSTPNATKTLYTGPITLTATTTLKAIVIKAGFGDSEVVTETYTYSEIATTSLNWQTTSGTVVGNMLTLPDNGHAHSSLTIDSTVDFYILCDVTTGSGSNYMTIAIDADINEVAWGGPDPYYSGFILIGDALYRMYNNAGAESLFFTPTMPSKVRLRKLGNDILIETSPDGTTWTLRDTRAGILSGVTTVRVKALALYASSMEAVLVQ